jgi:uncharacterized protein YprB with RNaseH-like and TPR domain
MFDTLPICMSGVTVRAYLDIETTHDARISVIGIYRHDRGTIQLIDGGITDVALYEALDGIQTLVTFNGASFDLPRINKHLRIKLADDFAHDDLMHICRKRGLRGGLKHIESVLGIVRDSAGIHGSDAPRLWHRFEYYRDTQALNVLLDYNRDDVVNLYRLEVVLGISPAFTENTLVQQHFI